MRYIKFSQQESAIHRLRIGRTDIIHNIDMDTFIPELFESGLDVCRLKISLSDKDVYDKLALIGFPLATYSILVRQTIHLTEKHKNFTPELTILPYSYKQKEALMDMARTIIKNDTATYYENHIYSHLFNLDAVIESSASYFSFFDNALDPDKYTFLAYKDEQLVGFCTLQIDGENGEGIYMGLLPEYRSADFAKEFVYTEQMQSALRNCRTYSVSTVILNPRSLNTTLKSGMKITDILLNLNVFPFLDKGKETKKIFRSTLQNLLQHIYHLIAQEYPNMVISDFVLKANNTTHEEKEWMIYCPFITEKMIIFVYHDSEKQCHGHVKGLPIHH
ncbi:MAG: GNAT family N-acetyltransferase [Chitinophagales bacterium]|nr:GNAT family N-acetyltransferase [Chitinophagales bacterium]